jgi:division protein CdvB (Snf7/Vps24/ESCRT-III family)
MSGKSLKNWEKGGKEGVFRKIEGKIHHGPPLKERISEAVYRLKTQQDKLAQAVGRMENHDHELFGKCVAAQVSKDQARAALYANECAEVRKMAKLILHSQLALEQVALRLETIEQFGDFASMMGPVSGVVHTLRGQLSGVMPEVSYELGSINDMLGGIVVDAGETSSMTTSLGTPGEEAQRILAEANAIADQKMKDRFPELPSAAAAPERAYDR